MKKKPSEDVLHSVTESGKPAPRRIISPKACFSIFERSQRHEENLAESNAAIQGLIDGNPPYPPTELKRMGQSWRANVNYREAESIRDSNMGAYWSLTVDVPSLISVKVREKAGALQPSQDYGQIIAEEYTDLMMEWEDYFFNYMLGVGEMLTFGLGPLVWTDRWDWRSKAFHRSNIMIPAKTRSTIGDLNIFFVRDSFSASQLFGYIEDEEIAQELGWNVSEMKKVAIDKWYNGKLTDTNRYQESVWQSLQRQQKNKDFFQDDDDETNLSVVHCFVKEVSNGKVSHYIILESEERKNFLLHQEREYNAMSEVICPFIFSIGDGYFRSVNGIGKRMFQSIEISNRMINTTFDGAMLSASMIVQGGLKKDSRLTRMGPITYMPDGATPISQGFAPNLNQLIAARSMLQSILNNNHGVYQKEVEHPGQPQRTAREAMIKEQKETRLQNFQIYQYYVHMDRWHNETVRRLLDPDYPKDHDGWELREKFLQRCKDRGVPPEILKYPRLRIRSMRAIGSGSPSIRQMIMDRMIQGSGSFDQRGRVNVTRDWIAAYAGYDASERYLPIQNRDQIATTEHTLASIENAILASGKPVVVGVDQLHGIHLQIHIPQIVEVVKGIMGLMQQGQMGDPTETIQYLSVALPHVNQTIQYFATDPRNKAQAKDYIQVVGAADQLLTQLIKQQEKRMQEQGAVQQANAEALAEAQSAAQSDELKEKLAKVQAGMQIEMAGVKGKMQIKEMQVRHKMMLDEIKLRQKLNAQALEQAGKQESQEIG